MLPLFINEYEMWSGVNREESPRGGGLGTEHAEGSGL